MDHTFSASSQSSLQTKILLDFWLEALIFVLTTGIQWSVQICCVCVGFFRELVRAMKVDIISVLAQLDVVNMWYVCANGNMLY